MIYCLTDNQHFQPEIYYTFRLVFDCLLKTSVTIVNKWDEIPSNSKLVVFYGNKIPEPVGRPVLHLLPGKLFSGKSYLYPGASPRKAMQWVSGEDLMLAGDFPCGKTLPILYESKDCGGWTERKNNQLIIRADFIASIFWLVTRCEEVIQKTRDEFDRFPATASLASQQGFLHRPVINEYAEVIWQWIKILAPALERKKKRFRAYITHDVDHPVYQSHLTCMQTARRMVGDLVKRHSFKAPVITLKRKLGLVNDPFDQFDWLMDLSEKCNLKSRFYFMATEKNDYERGYDIKSDYVKNIISNIQKRGHIIGFHPGFYTYKDYAEWDRQKTKLEETLGYEVKEGRQHFLRFEVPETWQIWHQAEMKMDSTLCFADHIGFRCGIAEEYPVYDVKHRKALDLKEAPLSVQEMTLFGYQKMSIAQARDAVQRLIENAASVNGLIVLLWHNSYFERNSFQMSSNELKRFYSEVMDMISANIARS